MHLLNEKKKPTTLCIVFNRVYAVHFVFQLGLTGFHINLVLHALYCVCNVVVMLYTSFIFQFPATFSASATSLHVHHFMLS